MPNPTVYTKLQQPHCEINEKTKEVSPSEGERQRCLARCVTETQQVIIRRGNEQCVPGSEGVLRVTWSFVGASVTPVNQTAQTFTHTAAAVLGSCEKIFQI